jgi:hypothetical protein
MSRIGELTNKYDEILEGWIGKPVNQEEKQKGFKS